MEVPECAAANTAPAALSVTTDSMPDWALTILRSDTDIARAVAVKGTKLESPHKTRLAQGIKVPDSLRDGKLAEHWLQVRLFYTIETQFPKAYPHIFAVPNGGHRAAKTASYMRYEGQKKGTPDIVLPLPRGCYHGMFLEVKTDKGTVSKEQKQKLEEYSELGYYAVASKGFEACIARYLAISVCPFLMVKVEYKEIPTKRAVYASQTLPRSRPKTFRPGRPQLHKINPQLPV